MARVEPPSLAARGCPSLKAGMRATPHNPEVSPAIQLLRKTPSQEASTIVATDLSLLLSSAYHGSVQACSSDVTPACQNSPSFSRVATFSGLSTVTLPVAS